MPFDFGEIVERTAPARWTRDLRYRRTDDLPYDIATVLPTATLILDTTVYIDQFQSRLQPQLVELIAVRDVYHAAPVLSELALTLGYLNPTDPRTTVSTRPLHGLFETIGPQRIVAPDAGMWVEGAILSGILSRTQHIPKERRRKFLNDALLYLLAEDTRATLISRNSRDLDLLMQIRPGVDVLLYQRA